MLAVGLPAMSAQAAAVSGSPSPQTRDSAAVPGHVGAGARIRQPRVGDRTNLTVTASPAARQSPNPHDGVPRGIARMRGAVSRNAATGGEPTASEMTYHGGATYGSVMETRPLVYIVYWGSQWERRGRTQTATTPL